MRTSTSLLLEARGVTRRFGGLLAVDDVSLVVRQGEALGLVGANGAGKTTLFNALSGFDRPTSGDVLLRGSSIVGLKRHKIVRRGLARTFQIVRPFPDLTVQQNIMVPITAAGAADPKGEATRVLRRVGLDHRWSEPASRLSEGDLKRLEMARALATSPSVLLLDEPFAGLSRAEILRLSETILELKEDGVSLVIVEHKIGALLQLVDRVVAMDHGKVIAEGDPHAVMSHPDVVRAYLGGGEA